MTILGAGINVIAFVGTNYVFNKRSHGDVEAELKLLAKVGLQKAKYK